MFGNSLDNLGKSIGECKNKHSDKMTFQHFKIFFMKSSEVMGNLRNSLDIFGNFRKILEICHKVLKITFHHF